MRQVLAELEHLRRKTRAMLFVQRGAVLLAGAIGVVSVLLLLDYSLRLPSALRLLMLVAGLALLFVGLARYVLAVLDYRPTLTQLALRVERAMPSVRGRLASGVEFAMSGLDEDNPLAARSVREAQRRLSGESVNRIVRSGRLARDVVLLGVVALAAAVFVAVSPATAQTGLLRLFAPYGSTQWPARTAVGSLMSEVLPRDGVHPRGLALALRARNRTDGDPAGRVDAHYRIIPEGKDGAFGPWRQVVLTHQGGGVHERLVDTRAESIEVYFATEDARTEPERIRLVMPPAVNRATLVVTPPAYAEGRRATLVADLGPGLDDRAVTESPSLVGSRASLVLELNKPLPVEKDAPARATWLARTLGWDAPGTPLPTLTVLPDGDAPMRWQLDWTLRATRTLNLELRDEYGLTNGDPISYRIEAVADTPPSVTITEPQSDIAVARTARVPLVGEAKDDVAVVDVGLRADVLRADGASEPLSFAPQRAADAATAGIEAEIDLRDLPLSEGDVVLVTAVADDGFQLDGARHDTAVSSPRRLRIVSELDLSAQLRRQLSAVRQNAIRMESQQGEVQHDVIESGPQPGLAEAQAQIADRIATQRDVIEDLEAQVERNRLDDAQLETLLQQSSDLLDYAGRAANAAVEAIEAREEQARKDEEQGRPERGDPPARPDEERAADEPAEKDRPVVDAQQEVRDELADLIELLDRDEDTWMVQRQLQSLIEGQQRLAEATARLAEETIGQSLDDLDQPQLTELDRIAQRQRELRDQLRRLIEEMRRRAEALEELDPQAAGGMRTAADTGEQREVDRDMEAAAERAGQNQLQSAGASQQAAMTSLQHMQEDLEETKRARAEELLRQLASLLESIERLVVAQENELMTLAQAEERDDFTGRDRAAIRLSQNTRSVATEARAAGQEARRVARALDRAADAQDAAVVALRAQPRDAAAARTAEERALAQLKEAKELAKELEKQTQQEQVQQAREELIAAYRALAEKQIAVRAETLALAGSEELTRRELVEARRLGNAQQEIRTGASDLEAQTQEILQSEVFHFVHGLIDDWSGAVSDALWEGAVDVNVTDRQQMIADSIARQIEAIEESQSPPEEFEEQAPNAPGGGGGAQPPPLIPPVAEVKRLHGLQEQVYEQTRAIDGRDDLDPGQRRQRVRELGRMQGDLRRLGESLLEKMQSGGGPGAVQPVTPPADPPETPDLPDPSDPPATPDQPEE